ncbi:MAG: hypothetical protein K1060chlam1_00510 [Candidatus Anoxychlamydiales bacterium]|nr:hypothetical protein [Candidatus Anoxychlamydiales bacterium]
MANNVASVTSSAKAVGQSILDKGSNAVKWGAHKVGGLGGSLGNTARSVKNYVFGFFKNLNLSHHLSVAGTHLSNFYQHVKNNKVYSLGIAGIAAGITYLAVVLLTPQPKV